MTLRSPFIRAGIALLFAVPAAIAGYYAALGVAHICIPAEGWSQAMALIGAIVVAATAWTRMMLSAPRPMPDKALPLPWPRSIRCGSPGRAELPPCMISRAAEADFGFTNA